MPFARGAERRFPAAQHNFQSRGPTSTARILAIRCLSLHLPGKADPRGAGRSAGMDGAATGHKFRRDGSGFQVVWGVVGFGAWKGLQRNGICMKHVGSKHAMLLFACRQPCLRQAQQLQQMTKARVGCARAKGRELAVGRRSARARRGTGGGPKGCPPNRVRDAVQHPGLVRTVLEAWRVQQARSFGHCGGTWARTHSPGFSMVRTSAPRRNASWPMLGPFGLSSPCQQERERIFARFNERGPDGTWEPWKGPLWSSESSSSCNNGLERRKSLRNEATVCRRSVGLDNGPTSSRCHCVFSEPPNIAYFMSS